jgi:hypothetical protein
LSSSGDEESHLRRRFAYAHLLPKMGADGWSIFQSKNS